jgi:NTE family protein
MEKGYPKIGIALGSGGARGLAHIGVLKKLEYYGIPVSFIAGSSIGAFIGAYYAAHPKIDKLEEFILNFDKKQGFKLFDPTLRGGLLKGDKIEKFISNLLENPTFETLKIPFAAVATDVNSANSVVIKSGDLIKAVRASISVPAVFQPITYEGRLLADAGLSNPIPDNVVREMGAEIVISVNLDKLYSPSNLVKTPSLAQVPMHSISILRHNLALNSMQTSDVIVSPKTPPIGLVGWNYFFNTEKAAQIILAGEKALDEVLPQLKKVIEDKRKDKNSVKKFIDFFKKS